MNPLLLRSLRQEVRNRAFLGVYLAILAAGAITSAVVASNQDGDHPGRPLFLVLSLACTFALWLSQPLNAYRAMAREREDDTWDLMELTGLTPWRIALGVVGSSLVQGLFTLAAIAPFLAVSYLLRGVDAVTLGIFLVMALASGVTLGAFATLLGCLGRTKAARTGLASMLTIGLLLLWFVSWPFMFEITSRSSIASTLASDPVGGWLITAAWLWHILLAGWCCVALAVTVMTHRASDRSRLPRLVLLVVVGDIALTFGGNAWYNWPNSTADICGAGAIMAMIAAVIGGLFALAEDHDLSAHQNRIIAQPRGWRRPLTWILGPGAARGLVFFLVATIPAWVLGSCSTVAASVDHLTAIAIMFGYACAHLGLGDALSRTVLQRWTATPMARRIFLFSLIIGISLLSAVASVVSDIRWLLVLNPMIAPMAAFERHDDYHELLGKIRLFALIGGAIGLAWLVISSIRHWRPATRQVLAGADDRNPRGG